MLGGGATHDLIELLVNLVEVVEPHIDIPLLPHYHLENAADTQPGLVHLLASEKELDGIGPSLTLRLLLAVRIHLEYLLIGDVHGDQPPREHLDGPLGPLIHLREDQWCRVGRCLLFDELGYIGHFDLRVDLVIVRTIYVVKVVCSYFIKRSGEGAPSLGETRFIIDSVPPSNPKMGCSCFETGCYTYFFR